MGLTDDEKWDAFVRCDESYDGLYFAAVKTTRIFCRPSCRVRAPLRKNVVFYDTREEAAEHGFRPCKRCRPDLIDYRPLEETAGQLKELIDRRFLQKEQLLEELEHMGASFGHLTFIFRRQYGMTPFEYGNRLRVEHAVRLLEKPGAKVADIAYGCGFESLSAFYRLFKKHTGMKPGEYRGRQSKKESTG